MPRSYRPSTRRSVVKKMDTNQTSSIDDNLKPVLKSNECESTHFRNDSLSVRLLEDLQSLRKNEVLCDIRFEADDGKIITGHKIVLMSASLYFRAMFSNFDESNKDLVAIRELDSTILQILVDYIYTGEIIVTKENVQVLLPAANLLQLDYVNGVCAEFLKKQLDTSNCLGIRAFADFHNCAELLSTSEAFIKKHFLEVVKDDEFLSLSFEDLVKLISCDDLAVPLEEKVFEYVIKWIKHDIYERKNFLPELMEHVRLPLLVSRPDVLNKVIEEPLLRSSPKCNNFILEALRFNLHKSIKNFTIPKTKRFEIRRFGDLQKIILLFNRSDTTLKCYTEWYDPANKLRNNPSMMGDCHDDTACFGVIRDKIVIAIGLNKLSSKSVRMLDISSSYSWVPFVDMLVSRTLLGVGVLNDCVYAVGGISGTNVLNSVEVLDISIQKWQMVSSLPVTRCNLGVGVLNNRLYAVGGRNNSLLFKSVECYDPGLDTWTPVSEMSVSRAGVGVGVLDGVMYAVGGYDGSGHLRSAEAYRPSDGVWYTITDMHLRRNRPGVIALNGLLYVIGGEMERSTVDTVEIYNPKSNTWSIETFPKCGGKLFGGVVIDRPICFISDKCTV